MDTIVQLCEKTCSFCFFVFVVPLILMSFIFSGKAQGTGSSLSVVTPQYRGVVSTLCCYILCPQKICVQSIGFFLLLTAHGVFSKQNCCFSSSQNIRCTKQCGRKLFRFKWMRFWNLPITQSLCIYLNFIVHLWGSL